jgi:hypothetical protein
VTAGRFGAVDLDLLADYVGGVLDGTPDETVVSRLITEDLDWSRAYAELAPAVETVRASLAAWGATSTVMPTDVADRITAALCADPVVPATPVEAGSFEPGAPVGPTLLADADLAATDLAATDLAATGSPRIPGQPHAERHLVAVPGGKRTTDGDRDTAAARRRRRWSRLAGPVAVAAAVTVLGGFGVSRLLGTGVDTQKAGAPDAGAPAGSSAAAPGSGEQPRALLGPAVERPLASGTDYTAGTLAATVDDLAGRSTPATKAGPAAAEGGRLQASGGLGRLTDRAALTACLDAVAGEHAGGPIAVELLDYAAFDGNPALVILFTDRSPARWAWVTGPECGVPGSGTDTRYQSRVG